MTFLSLSLSLSLIPSSRSLAFSCSLCFASLLVCCNITSLSKTLERLDCSFLPSCSPLAFQRLLLRSFVSRSLPLFLPTSRLWKIKGRNGASFDPHFPIATKPFFLLTHHTFVLIVTIFSWEMLRRPSHQVSNSRFFPPPLLCCAPQPSQQHLHFSIGTWIYILHISPRDSSNSTRPHPFFQPYFRIPTILLQSHSTCHPLRHNSNKNFKYK